MSRKSEGYGTCIFPRYTNQVYSVEQLKENEIYYSILIDNSNSCIILPHKKYKNKEQYSVATDKETSSLDSSGNISSYIDSKYGTLLKYINGKFYEMNDEYRSEAMYGPTYTKELHKDKEYDAKKVLCLYKIFGPMIVGSVNEYEYIDHRKCKKKYTVTSTQSTVTSTQPTVTSTQSTVTSTQPTVTPTQSTVTSTQSTVTSTQSTVTPNTMPANGGRKNKIMRKQKTRKSQKKHRKHRKSRKQRK